MDIRKKDRSLTLNCFTPLASLVTFAIEIALALYVIIRYRMTAFGRLCAVLLVLLGTFQLAEYSICNGTNPEAWAKVAFLSITYLPILALHMISLATGRRLWTNVGYGSGTAFMAVILFSRSVFIGTVCTGKYVIFHVATDFSNLYLLYYLGFLVAGILVLVYHLQQKNGKDRLLMAWFLGGYMSFIVPTFFLYVMVPSTKPGFASILCGFALLFAAILVVKVLPLYQQAARRPKENGKPGKKSV